MDRKARRNRKNWGGSRQARKGRELTYAPKCGKVRYTSWQSADTAAQLQTEKHGTPTRCYRCRTCLGWHLTTQPRRT